VPQVHAADTMPAKHYGHVYRRADQDQSALAWQCMLLNPRYSVVPRQHLLIMMAALIMKIVHSVKDKGSGPVAQEQQTVVQ